ncbi:hypothetical protein CERSUDRAFT_112273 [Gelatoporia subvermispora B]|uniref:Uncharacterized protein n=1 Tax=Ceriporiopsis subvermispora (strain B) TaxID=914234 RepID=M2PTL5_CERS8|nr:hypothetical protein CERSUDRAFT_112273 [Gelatoporia subvermispora B]
MATDVRSRDVEIYNKDLFGVKRSLTSVAEMSAARTARHTPHVAAQSVMEENAAMRRRSTSSGCRLIISSPPTMLWPTTTFLQRRACIGTANGRERSLAGRRDIYIEGLSGIGRSLARYVPPRHPLHKPPTPCLDQPCSRLWHGMSPCNNGLLRLLVGNCKPADRASKTPTRDNRQSMGTAGDI